MARSLLTGILLSAALLQADGGSATAAEQKVGAEAAAAFGRQTCSTIADEAARNGLPASFFARLIWRESLFNPSVVSPKGAQGIAQFMPGTALERGLKDPFDATTALGESADYLTELKTRFGSLGLAAAAYNAGPTRVATWLKGGSELPTETQDYVIWITGHSAEDWSSAEKALPVLPIADGMSFATACRKLAARGLTAKLPDPSLRRSGWQALFAAGLGITQVKASAPGRTRIVIDLNHGRKTEASVLGKGAR
jgi:hypothetical protein